ncbi:MAG: hypothetical protein HY302_03455 [Opitutae bacterium]|nr:hypothetical protein [Opitutae bacterium]
MSWLFEWLDASSGRYWTVAWTCFGSLLVSVFTADGNPPATAVALAPWRRRFAEPVVFAMLTVLTLAAFRWPVWFAPAGINPDEDQMLASAITLRHFPIFWKYVDGTTHGPLNDYLLVATAWFGLPFNYLGARLVATLLQAGALLCVWGMLRRLAPERVGRLAILPGLCFWSFTTFHDFTQYSSEHLAIALVAGAAFAGTHALTAVGSRRRQRWAFASCGLLAGMTPFAKLQLVPLAAFVVVCSALAAWWRERRFSANLVRDWLALGAGGFAFPLLVTVCLAIYGLGGQFNLSYILANLRHVESGSLSFEEQPGKFLAFAFGTPGVGLLLAGSLAVALGCSWPGLTGGSLAARARVVLAWIGMSVAVVCIVTPGRELTHYLQIFVVPCCALVGVALASAWEAEPEIGRTTARFPLVLFLALTVVPPVVFRATQLNENLGQMLDNRVRLVSPTGQFLRDHAKDGDTLTVWGWLPRLHVETQLPQGTRDSMSERQLVDSPLRDAFRDRYLRDMQRRRPTWFVDSVGPTSFGFHSRPMEGYESFPALAALVRSDYVFVTEVDHVRIFRLHPMPPASRDRR